MHAFSLSALVQRLRVLVGAKHAAGQTDSHLLEQFVVHRDEVAFAGLVQRHGAMVLNVCRRVLHDEHLTEDAFQATFLILAQKARTIGRPDALAGWLHGVALRLAHNSLAKSARALRGDRRQQSRVAAGPEAEVSWKEMQGVFDEELQRLPEKYRLPLVLCCLEGRTRDEAARQLGCTVDKVKGLLERGREQFRARLRRRGVTLSTAASAAFLSEPAWSASVPALLTASTVKAGLGLAAGSSLADCGVSSAVARLVERGLQIMAVKKLVFVVALIISTITLGSGVAYLASGTPGQAPAVAALGVPGLPAAGTPAQGREAPKPAKGEAKADQDKQPARTIPRYIDPATVAAYEKLGAVYGGYVQTDDSFFIFREGRENAEKGVPGFRFKQTPRGKLPEVAVPFFLDLRYGGLSHADLKQLAHLTKLKVLCLLSCNLSDPALKELAAFKDLSSLNLVFGDFTEAGLKELVPLKNLTSIRMYAITPLTLEGYKVLASFTNLTTLGLRCETTDAGLKELTALKNLSSLMLNSKFVTDAGLKELARLRKLTYLNIECNAVTDAGLEQIGRLDNLRLLYLSGWDVTSAGFKHLAKLEKLERLMVSSQRSNISDVGLKDLAQLQNLTELDLMPSWISDVGLKDLARLKNLRRLGLGANGHMSDVGLKELASLSQLADLDLSSTQVTDAGVKVLASFPNLATLSLYNTKITAAAWNDLASFKKLTNLTVHPQMVTDVSLPILLRINSGGMKLPEKITELNLDDSQLTDAGLKNLAPFENLNSLSLSNTKVSNAGLKELAPLVKLRQLVLKNTPVSDVGLKELARFEKLEKLDLAKTHVTDAGLKEVAPLKNLVNLDLGDTKVTDAGLESLAPVQNLVTLGLSGNQITGSGLKHLAPLKYLTNILLDRTPMADAGLKEVAALTNLEGLFLNETSVTDAGLKELASLKNLGELGLGKTWVTDAGLKSLTHLKYLGWLHVNGSKVTDAGIAALQKELPRCRIYR